jgi:hypothetical protein
MQRNKTADNLLRLGAKKRIWFTLAETAGVRQHRAAAFLGAGAARQLVTATP